MGQRTPNRRKSSVGSRFDKPLLLCFSHLRWDFVWQRPQQILSRAARDFDVVFVEEPVAAETAPAMELRPANGGVLVAVPRLPPVAYRERVELQRALLRATLSLAGSRKRVLWHYTPTAASDDLPADVSVYDKMDELSAFLGAPPEVRLSEDRLLATADLVFAGGKSLWESLRGRRPDARLFPSSVDAAHFGRARALRDVQPQDKGETPFTIGFFEVIDERMDTALVERIARLRPDWRIEMIGPVVKISADTLPWLPNIQWLGPCPYADLPDRLARWDVGIMPFALNEATRYISPTKTPEFLAAGVPLVSSPVADVVHDYGDAKLVSIAATPEAFVEEIERARMSPRARWLERVDARLATGSWDATWDAMRRDIERVFTTKAARKQKSNGEGKSDVNRAFKVSRAKTLREETKANV